MEPRSQNRGTCGALPTSDIDSREPDYMLAVLGVSIGR